MDTFELYKDIVSRTAGDIYIGVVGPVRTGKSTFITRFMEKLVLPNITDANRKQRIIDELPQSADGKTIMTTQPKFVPDSGVEIEVRDGLSVKVRLVDCVGYLIDGAEGAKEGDKVRLVNSPWSEKELPFEQVAEIGTEKVIKEHSTIGVLLTTDGSITNIERANYVSGEERVAKEMSAMGKPYVIVLNSKSPKSEKTIALVKELKLKYGAPVIAINVKEMELEDIYDILECVLMEFPISSIECNMPKWMQTLDITNEIIENIMKQLIDVSNNMNKIADYKKLEKLFENDKFMSDRVIIKVEFGTGRIMIDLMPKPELFYNSLASQCGVEISDDFELFAYVKKTRFAESQYSKLKDALSQAEEFGYGIVTPAIEEMVFNEPEFIKKGNKSLIRLRADAPCLHIIKVDVSTEVNPLGSAGHNEEMTNYLMKTYEENKQGIWDTNLFGKTLNNIAQDNLNKKVFSMPIEAQKKLRKTVTRIINEGKGGIMCILL